VKCDIRKYGIQGEQFDNWWTSEVVVVGQIVKPVEAWKKYVINCLID